MEGIEVKQKLWEVKDITKTVVQDLAGNIIYDGADYDVDYQTAKDRAKLIAAAPDTYQSTYDLVDNLTIWMEEGKFRYWPESDVNLMKELIQQGEQAIKRATE